MDGKMTEEWLEEILIILADYHGYDQIAVKHISGRGEEKYIMMVSYFKELITAWRELNAKATD